MESVEGYEWIIALILLICIRGLGLINTTDENDELLGGNHDCHLPPSQEKYGDWGRDSRFRDRLVSRFSMSPTELVVAAAFAVVCRTAGDAFAAWIFPREGFASVAPGFPI